MLGSSETIGSICSPIYHTFEYVGSGTDYSTLTSVVFIEINQTLELGGVVQRLLMDVLE